jgi:hypothetical protein
MQIRDVVFSIREKFCGDNPGLRNPTSTWAGKALLSLNFQAQANPRPRHTGNLNFVGNQDKSTTADCHCWQVPAGMYSTPPSSRPLSYAPTPYGYTPNISLAARINLDEEVKLADSATERDLVDSLAEIYSIIRTLDGLEKAYIKDALPESEYSEMAAKLMKQYQSLLNDDTVSREFVDLDTFCRKWDVCTQ